MNIEKQIAEEFCKAIEVLYSQTIEIDSVQISKTRKDIQGDFTINVFPYLKTSKKSPEQTANEIGNQLNSSVQEIDSFEVVKGFLNIILSDSFWITQLNSQHEIINSSPKNILIEFSSPNTNKPLHLGHIRNNLLGHSISEILKANKHTVSKVNLVNDRGIHICKSMLAWQKWGNGETPESSGKKGDKLVGDYYVLFDKEYKKQIADLIATGKTQKEAENQAELIHEARELLLKWESSDPEVYDLWNKMNGWVYKGFEKTYKELGIIFDKTYYESETYWLGKFEVIDGKVRNIFIEEEDGSIWADLTSNGLDKKLLLRSDGTSVYMTQDIGTAIMRKEEFNADEMVYVVGNEQNYHFQVLKLVLKKLGHDWAEKITHLSYGMVELPEGKMKSREGTVVDADDLIEEMCSTAKSISEELGKLDGLTEEEIEKNIKMVGLGALKYFILKVDPKKNMVFNPKESIDFDGNTGPFIQYTHARISSIIRKAKESNISINENVDTNIAISDPEKQLLKSLSDFENIVVLAGTELNPALIANYVYALVKEYNFFYHNYPILKETDPRKLHFRLMLSKAVADKIKRSMFLLGIDVPERM